MPSAMLARRPLRVEDLAHQPTLRIHGCELSTLTDPFGIDDWRTCSACAAHTPHAGGTCLACEPPPQTAPRAA